MACSKIKEARLAMLGMGLAVGLSIFILGVLAYSILIMALGILALTAYVGLALLPEKYWEDDLNGQS